MTFPALRQLPTWRLGHRDDFLDPESRLLPQTSARDWFHVKHPEPCPVAPTEHTEQLEELRFFILQAAKNQNLVSPGDLDHLWDRHILDSLSPLLVKDQLQLDIPGVWIDMGSGAGFPVLPLSICLPHWTFFAIEPRRLRVQHLEEAAAKLGLDNLKVIGSKAEPASLRPELRNKARIVSARAVGKIPDDAKRAVPFLGEGGTFLTFKHSEYVERIDGYHPLSYVPYRLPSGDASRNLVLAPISQLQAKS